MLRKVFGEADAVPASILSSCVNCLLGVERQDDTLQCVRCCANWWRDDNEDFARQLQTLLRGGQPAALKGIHMCECMAVSESVWLVGGSAAFDVWKHLQMKAKNISYRVGARAAVPGIICKLF